MLKKIITIYLVLILTSFTVLPFTSFAATQSELNNQKNEIQNNINEAEERRDEIVGEKSETQSEIDKLNDEIEAKEAEIETITTELNGLNEEVTNLTNQLNEAQEKYDKQYDSLCTRVAKHAKRKNISYLDVLLGASSLSDLISGVHMIEKIAEYDTELLGDIEEQRNIIETTKEEVSKKQEEVAKKQNELKIEQISLTNRKTSKNKYLSQLSEEDQELQKTLDEMKEKLRQTEAELSAFAKGSSAGFKYTGGTLNWPLSTYRISSGFGYRGSAATGGVGTANHNGYDLAVGNGTPIYAAESGTVIKVVTGCTHNYPKTAATRCYCGGGYGNYFMIQHDNGLTTLYGHCSSINVSVGQRVTRGQQVAAVGSCGWSTGYHLHFSVLLNGTYVNPGDYLS